MFPTFHNHQPSMVRTNFIPALQLSNIFHRFLILSSTFFKFPVSHSGPSTFYTVTLISLQGLRVIFNTSIIVTNKMEVSFFSPITNFSYSFINE